MPVITVLRSNLVEGNRGPAWERDKYLTTYPEKGRWVDDLWCACKLEHVVYKRYLYLCRDGVMPRRKNFDAVIEHEYAQEEEEEMESTKKRIRTNPELV